MLLLNVFEYILFWLIYVSTQSKTNFLLKCQTDISKLGQIEPKLLFPPSTLIQHVPRQIVAATLSR